jgi:hypothetical protein
MREVVMFRLPEVTAKDHDGQFDTSTEPEQVRPEKRVVATESL